MPRSRRRRPRRSAAKALWQRIFASSIYADYSSALRRSVLESQLSARYGKHYAAWNHVSLAYFHNRARELRRSRRFICSVGGIIIRFHHQQQQQQLTRIAKTCSTVTYLDRFRVWSSSRGSQQPRLRFRTTRRQTRRRTSLKNAPFAAHHYRGCLQSRGQLCGKRGDGPREYAIPMSADAGITRSRNKNALTANAMCGRPRRRGCPS
jgi:hypothetical protein